MQLQKKIPFGLVLSCLLLNNITSGEREKVTLDSKILHMFDGVPFALDGDAFDDMLHVRKAVHTIQFGKRNPQTSELEGLYKFGDTFYTIEQLAALEEEKGLTEVLKELLEQAKDDLVNIAEPFMIRARGTKHFLLPIMNDWAKKRNRQDTALLKWHDEEEGTEAEIFKKDVTTFVKMRRFCDDMVLFMEDLMYNCPKGFDQLLKKKRAQKR